MLVVLLSVRLYPVVVYDGGTLHQKLHWIVYGYDRVWYRNRTYVSPSKPMSFTQLEKTYGDGEKFIPTGATVIGLPVYATASDLSFQKRQHVSPTLLFLKKVNGSFIVYSLSGGP